MKLFIKDIISSKCAISMIEGIAVFEALDSILDSHDKVELSFGEMEDCTTLFLNYSIGKIYEKHNDTSIVDFVDLADDSIWNKKISRTKKYFSSPEVTAEYDKINGEVTA
jgi:hypothetical protein